MHIIFDLDGTLLDMEYDVSAADAKLATEHGWPTTADEVFLELSGLSGKEKFERIAQKHGVAPTTEEIEVLSEKHEQENHDLHHRPVLTAIPGAPQLLDKLEKHGHTLSLGSSTPTTGSKPALEKLGLAQHFNERVFGPDNSAGHRKKPAPDIYLQAMKGHEDEINVVVEDSVTGAIAGHAAGAFVIARLDPRFGTGAAAAAKTAEFRANGADIVIRDYTTEFMPALTLAARHNPRPPAV